MDWAAYFNRHTDGPTGWKCYNQALRLWPKESALIRASYLLAARYWEW